MTQRRKRNRSTIDHSKPWRPPPHRTNVRSWFFGVYAMVLLLLLVMIILFIRSFSTDAARVYLDATKSPDTSQADVLSSPIDDSSIQETRHIVRQALDHAQRQALIAMEAPESTP